VTHVSVARPHYLDMELNPVSEDVRRIVEFINAHPKCTHKQLLQALAPAAAVAALPTPPAREAAVAAEAAPSGTEAPPSAPAAEVAEPTPELAAVMTDLHWLIHQGHVIEFANGILETAKKPLPKPEKTQGNAAAATPAEAAPVEGEIATATSPTAVDVPPAVGSAENGAAEATGHETVGEDPNPPATSSSSSSGESTAPVSNPS
jgi:hypothetical protein